MAGTIQRYESDQYRIPIFCLFCGQKVFDPDNLDNMDSPCAHTLFIAHDAAFEYRSPAFNASVGLKADDDMHNPDIGDYNYDTFTDLVNIKNSIKLAIYIPPPGCSGFYIGFSP